MNRAARRAGGRIRPFRRAEASHGPWRSRGLAFSLLVALAACSTNLPIGSEDRCSHSECASGWSLRDGCSSCVSLVCAADAYCCNASWNSRCVAEAESACAGEGLSCGGGDGGGPDAGGCTHGECEQGPALADGCSPCVSTVCAADVYCCSADWNARCVSEARSECAADALPCGGADGGGAGADGGVDGGGGPRGSLR